MKRISARGSAWKRYNTIMEKKIELTPEEIEKIQVQAFNEGYNAGQYLSLIHI